MPFHLCLSLSYKLTCTSTTVTIHTDSLICNLDILGDNVSSINNLPDSLEIVQYPLLQPFVVHEVEVYFLDIARTGEFDTGMGGGAHRLVCNRI